MAKSVHNEAAAAGLPHKNEEADVEKSLKSPQKSVSHKPSVKNS